MVYILQRNQTLKYLGRSWLLSLLSGGGKRVSKGRTEIWIRNLLTLRLTFWLFYVISSFGTCHFPPLLLWTKLNQKSFVFLSGSMVEDFHRNLSRKRKGFFPHHLCPSYPFVYMQNTDLSTNNIYEAGDIFKTVIISC